MIRTQGLSKVYRVPLKEPGLMGSVRSLFNRKQRDIRAVDSVDMVIEPGERVGFLGPNGAGKTTTLKMLSGLLWPTGGSVTVDGFVPQERATDFLKRITLVMGQKQQLLWDLPPSETYLLNRALYDIPHTTWRDTLDELVELLELGPILDQPARNLSLGQRMRCELAAALIHRPRWLFLDEPTIGLDVKVQAQVRKFIAAYNERHGATVLLTSHDMDDVAALCERIILIDKGVIRFDGSIEAFAERFGTGRRVVVRARAPQLVNLGFEQVDGTWVATVQPGEVNALLSQVLQAAPEADLTVEDPKLEEILTRAFGDADASEDR